MSGLRLGANRFIVGADNEFEVRNAVWNSWLCASVVAVSIVAAAQLPDKAPARPKITGISHLAVYTSNPAATEHFYVNTVGAVKESRPGESGRRAVCRERNAVC